MYTNPNDFLTVAGLIATLATSVVVAVTLFVVIDQLLIVRTQDLERKFYEGARKLREVSAGWGQTNYPTFMFPFNKDPLPEGMSRLMRQNDKSWHGENGVILVFTVCFVAVIAMVLTALTVILGYKEGLGEGYHIPTWLLRTAGLATIISFIVAIIYLILYYRDVHFTLTRHRFLQSQDREIDQALQLFSS